MTNNATYELDNGVSTVRLARPEKLNAMTLEMWTTVADKIRCADEDGSHAVVLTGSGRTFCAGELAGFHTITADLAEAEVGLSVSGTSIVFRTPIY